MANNKTVEQYAKLVELSLQRKIKEQDIESLKRHYQDAIAIYQKELEQLKRQIERTAAELYTNIK